MPHSPKWLHAHIYTSYRYCDRLASINLNIYIKLICSLLEAKTYCKSHILEDLKIKELSQ